MPQEFDLNSTICAPATVPGSGAVALIRISGPKALEIASRTVTVKGKPIAECPGYRMRYGTVLGKDGRLVDEVVAGIYRAPHSYTGEDSVELCCHSSRYIVETIVGLLLENGARMALPGEFTRRAFIGGKMDLSQAEAVADVINASSALQHRVAVSQLRGGYSAELRDLRHRLLELSSLLELELDFSEEDVEFADRGRLGSILDETAARCRSLRESFRMGNAVKEGVGVAIVGAPNSGKSTLLNALLREDRAIVSDIPGTTRDTLEECCNIGGVTFRFIDTAGLRESSDAIESQGIQRALRKAKDAAVVLLVVDLSGNLADGFSAAAGALDFESQTIYVVLNKIDALASGSPAPETVGDSAGHICTSAESAYYSSADDLSTDGSLVKGTLTDGSTTDNPLTDWTLSNGLLTDDPSAEEVSDAAERFLGRRLPASRILRISAKNGTGIQELEDRLAADVCREIPEDGVVVTNLRHAEALQKTIDALERVRSGLDCGLAPDLLAEDLRDALAALGSITGEISSDEVLGNIFKNFCIGK